MTSLSDRDGDAVLHIVDPHQHFWNLAENPYPWLQGPERIPFRYGDYSPICKNYLPPDFRRDWGDGIVVDKTVHIEAEWDRASPVAETKWLEALSAREGLPTACVAFAQLDAPDAADIIAEQAASPLVRGIRCKPASTTDPRSARRGEPGSMDDSAWREGYAALKPNGLSFDLQTPWWHLDAAAELARDFPTTQIIINHTALPSDRSAEGLAGWRAGLERVAREPNVAIKISGIGLANQAWTVENNGPIIRDTISIFGTDRTMFASNFPVDSLIGDYATIFKGFAKSVEDLPDADRAKLLRENAIAIYRL
ncbi:amidohydrolase family protein [Acuticoccus kandeliae]|uniref:amidohydrolase family protein n=1 Tax=Acuticoccus kandeliae TaxID=2073160 RepID=UPI001FE2957D|nr:amidohydrolase family protein [Acuticoccus kandeliae]